MSRPLSMTIVLVAALAVWSDPSATTAQEKSCRRPSTTGCGNRPGSDYRSPLPDDAAGALLSYGSSVYSRSMASVHRQIAARIAVENRLRTVQVERAIDRPYLTYNDVARYREHHEVLAETTQIKLRLKLRSQAAVHEIWVQHNTEMAARLARLDAPKRLTRSQYDAATSVIWWPPLFREDERFAIDRDRIDVLFGHRSPQFSGLGSQNCLQVCQRAGRMKRTLKAMQGELDGTTYAAMKSFLKSVGYESHFSEQPAGVQQTAGRSPEPTFLEEARPPEMGATDGQPHRQASGV